MSLNLPPPPDYFFELQKRLPKTQPPSPPPQIDLTLIQLPNDVLTRIFSMVPTKDMSSVCNTNSVIHTSCSTEIFYLQKVEQEYPDFIKADWLTYEQFYKMLKIYEINKAKMFEIPDTVFWMDRKKYDNEDTSQLDELNEKVLPYVLLNFNIRRGDLIHLESMGDYRNDGKYIFDGDKFISLEFEPDDYGNLPKEFKILDDYLIFSPNYWLDVIDHNGYVHFDSLPYIDQLKYNLKQLPIKKTNVYENHTFVYVQMETFFVHSTGAIFKFTFTFDVNSIYNKESILTYLENGTYYIGSDNYRSTPYHINLYEIS